MINADQKIEFKSIDVLHFDPDNPRLPRSIDGHDDAQVIAWMLKDATLLELMGSIAEKGYFPGEPLFVVPAELDDRKPIEEKFIVVEGNRRLAAVKLLNNPLLAHSRKNAIQEAAETAKVPPPQRLPVIIFNNSDELLFYLGYRHVAGIKEWEPLAKARYLDRLASKIKGTYSQRKFQALARSIGSHWDTVARQLTGFNLYQKIEEHEFFNIEGLNEDKIEFSILTTALSFGNIVEFLGLTNAVDPTVRGLKIAALKELTSWLYEEVEGSTKLVESRNLKKLNKIVANPAALKKFRAGFSIDDAYRLTEGPAEAFSQSLLTARSWLQAAKDNLYLVIDVKEDDLIIADDIEKMVAFIRKTLKAGQSSENK